MAVIPAKGGVARLRFIAPLGFIICAVLLGLAANTLTQRLLNKQLDAMEAEMMRKMARQAGMLVEAETSKIALQTAHTAASDDIYKFAADLNAVYPESHFSAAGLTKSMTDLVLILNAKGEIIFSRRYNRATKTESYIPEPLQKAFAPSKKAFQTLLGGAPSPQGIMILDDAAMMMASYPIMKSDGGGPSRGALVLGRFINDAEAGRIGQSSKLDIKIQPFGFATGDMLSMTSDLLQEGAAFSALDRNTGGGYVLVKDIEDAPGIIVRVSFPRTPFNKLREAATLVSASIVAIAVILLGIWAYWIIRPRMIDRLDRMTRILKGIGSGPDAPDRVPIKGSDEITDLSHAINTILGAGGADRAAHLTAVSDGGEEGGLERSAALLKSSLESSPAAAAVLDTNGYILACNRKYIDLWRVLPEQRAAPSRQDRDEYFANQLEEPAAFLEKAVAFSAQPEAEGRLLAQMKDGKMIEMYSAPFRHREKIIGRVWIYLDVSWRKDEIDAAKKELVRLKMELESKAGQQPPSPVHRSAAPSAPPVSAAGVAPVAAVATAATAAEAVNEVEIEDYSHIFAQETAPGGSGAPSAAPVGGAEMGIPEITLEGMDIAGSGMTGGIAPDFSPDFTPEITLEGMDAAGSGMAAGFGQDYSQPFTPEITFDAMDAAGSGTTSGFTEDYSHHFSPDMKPEGTENIDFSLEPGFTPPPPAEPPKGWDGIEGLEIEIDK